MTFCQSVDSLRLVSECCPRGGGGRTKKTTATLSANATAALATKTPTPALVVISASRSEPASNTKKVTKFMAAQTGAK